MKGTDEYVLVDVTDVRVLSRYVTELTFDDGSVKVIDLEDWLTGPDFGWLLEDYPAFCEVTVDSESGTIRFSNGAEFSPAGLYLAAKAAVPGLDSGAGRILKSQRVDAKRSSATRLRPGPRSWGSPARLRWPGKQRSQLLPQR
jgi:hypothetical protein